MTEDYKEKLIKYMTGNINATTQTDEEIFKQINDENRQDWAGFIPSGWNAFKIEGIISASENTSGTSVLYGGYEDSNNNPYGFVILIDENFKPIKTFYEFEGGTPLRYIQCMTQLQDGTFCMIDDTGYTRNNDDFLNGTRRFVMLNNFTWINQLTNDYNLQLRKSYILQDTYNNFYCHQLFKNPNSSQYVMVGSVFDNIGNNWGSVKIIKLEINVGEANTWSYMVTNTPAHLSDPIVTFGSSYVIFSEENYSVKILCNYIEPGNVNKISIYSKNFTQNSLTKTDIYNITDDTTLNYSQNLSNQCVFSNNDEVYFVLTNQYFGTYSNYYIGLYYYNFKNNQVNTIYYKDLGQPTTSSYMHKELVQVYTNQGKLYIAFYEDSDEDNIANYYFQRFNGEWNPILVYENKPFIYSQRSLFVKNNFNLLQIYIYPNNMRSATWCFPTIKEVYNPTNYNGFPFEAPNCLVPNSSILYDTDDNIIFARNLYNKTVLGATTTSTVQIPNTMLNDVTIGKSDLISETNLPLTEDTTDITKNIYETVNLNFANSISIRNDNDPNNKILNPTASVRLNGSTTQNNNYDDVKATKVRVNYADGTNMVIALNPSEQINALTDTTYQYNFILQISKEVDNLQIISNDELTIYQTIDTLNLEVGKTYNILQNVEVQ